MYLTPGEAVVNRRSALANASTIDALNRYPGVSLPTREEMERSGGAQASAYDADRIVAALGRVEQRTGQVEQAVRSMQLRIGDRDVHDANRRFAEHLGRQDPGGWNG